MLFSVSRARLTGFLLLIAVVALDQWSKAAISAHAGEFPQDILPFFSLVLVHNRGISFGLLGQASPWGPLLLTTLTSLVVLVLVIWLACTREILMALTLGPIIGGAAGNIIDRLRYGSVTDFLDFHYGSHHWPAFNLADSAICIGVVILVLISIVRPSIEKEETK